MSFKLPSILLLFVLLICAQTACSTPGNPEPSPSEPTTQDASTNPNDAPEPQRCVANNDGIITIDEVSFVPDVSVNAMRNAPGSSVTVDHVGQDDSGTLTWDLRETTAKTATKVRTVGLKNQWFLSSFPNATLLIPQRYTGFQSTVYQVIRKTNNDLLLEGLASEAETPNKEKVLLPYDNPVPLLRFPLRDGKSWIVTAKTQGTLGGLPISSTDQYQIRVEGRGLLKLPDIEFDNTLRIVINVQQRFIGGNTRRLFQVLFMHECYGEVARIESQDNETNPAFTNAALLRYLSF